MKKAITLAVLASAFAGGSAHAVTWIYSELDSDRNLELVAREIRPVARHIFNAWDTDRNARLTPAEFAAGVFGWWDRNGDWRLDNAEFTQGWRAWGENFTAPAWNTFDSNGDGFVARNEFGTEFVNSGYFNTWDTAPGGYLDLTEFRKNLFGVWDANNDGILGKDEFAAWSSTLQRVANPIEPRRDPVDIAAEPSTQAGTNRIEPGYDPVDTAAEPRAVPGTRLMPISVIDEQNVYNLRGEELGEVEDIFLGPDGQYFAVVAFGEFLGLGGTHRAVPLSRMYYRNDRMVLPGVTEAELDTLPVWGADLAGFRPIAANSRIPVRVGSTNRIEPGFDPVDRPAEPNVNPAR